jgi:hypothetical protein
VIRTKDILAAPKSNLDWGKWDNAKMPPSAFPLSRRRGYSLRLGTAFRWRLVRFDACGHKFRLLLAFSIEKQQYRAILALDLERDLTVLVSYEFHGTHPGWHLLATCGDIAVVPAGVLIGPWQRRIPKARSTHRTVNFSVKDDDTAFNVGASFFRLHKAEGVLL